MNFWTSGRIDTKIDFDAFQPVMLEIENKVNGAIAEKDFGNSILSYDVVINIFEEKPVDKFRYSAKAKETDIDVSIDHDDFLKATHKERRVLYINAIILSVEKMRSHKKITNFDFENFHQTLLSIRDKLQNNPLVN